MPYYDILWHRDAQEIENTEYPVYHQLPVLIFFVKSKTQNQLIDSPCAWNNNELLQREARPQPSSLQIYGLLTVLTLILCITGYEEYSRKAFIGNLLKLNADELKRQLLIEVWFCIKQSVTDQTIDQWRVCLNACVKAKWKYFEHVLMMCYSTTVNNLLPNHFVTN